MSDLRNKVLLYRTNTSGVSAQADSIQHGELAMNFNAETPFLMFKDTNNDIVKIGATTNVLGESELKSMSQKGVTDALKLPENYVSVEYPEVDSTSFTKTESGTVIYDAIKQVDQNVATLVQEMLDNEEVIAAAITSLNNSSGFDENCKYIAPSESYLLSGASSLYEADLFLSNKIENIENSLTDIETNISDDYAISTYPTLEGDEQFDSIVPGDSLDYAAKKLEENIITLTNEVESKIDGVIKGVKINEVEGIVNEDKIVEVPLNGSDISLSNEYESVVYPTISDGSVVFSSVTNEMTIDEAIKQVDTTIAQLVSEVIKDESVVAAAITQINNSCGFNINCEYTPYEESEILSAATSLHEADALLENKLFDIADKVDGMTSNTLSNILINEKEGIVENGISTLNLDGSEIKLSSNYVSVEYPEIDEDVIFTPVTSEQTIDEAIKQLDSTVCQLVNEVLKDEQVVSNTLTVHNDSSGFDLNGKYITNTSAYFIYEACSLSQADSILDRMIYEVSASTSGLSSDLTNQVDNIQYNLDTISSDVRNISATVTSHTNSISNLNSQINNLNSQITNITTDIKVNGVASTNVNNVATVTISGSNIPLSSSYNTVEYPETVTAEFNAVTSSMTVESAINQLDTTIAQVVNEIIKDEKVIAAAMMRQNSSCGFDEFANYVPYNSSNIISGATSLAQADEMISDKIEEILNGGGNSVNNVTINEVNGNFNEETKIISLELNANDISLSEEYVAVEYPTVTSTVFSAVTSDLTIEESINRIDGSVSQLVNEMLDIEEVIAASLTQHNESCGFDENALYVPITSTTYISNASNLSEADVLLDSAVSELNNRIGNISVELSSSYTPITYDQVGEGDNDPTVAMVSNAVGNNLDTIVTTLENNINLLASEINENEFVAASALTDLNTRVETLELEVETIKTQLTSILSRLDALENPTE